VYSRTPELSADLLRAASDMIYKAGLDPNDFCIVRNSCFQRSPSNSVNTDSSSISESGSSITADESDNRGGSNWMVSDTDTADGRAHDNNKNDVTPANYVRGTVVSSVSDGSGDQTTVGDSNRGGGRLDEDTRRDSNGSPPFWYIGQRFFQKTREIAAELDDWFQDPSILSEWLLEQQQHMVLGQPLVR